MDAAVLLPAAAVALSLPVLWWGLAGARPATATLTRGRVRPATDLRGRILQQSAVDRALKPLLGQFGRGLKRLTPLGWVESLERRIVLAGRPAQWPLERVLAAKVVLAGIAIVLGGLAAAESDSPRAFVVVALVTLVAYFAPDVILHSRGTQRQQEIARSLPDTLDQVTISVEAGLGFDAAIARAARSGEGPLAEELVRTLQEIQFGVPRTKALRGLADRTTSADLRHFVLAIIQSDRYGIPIADVLRGQAVEQRLKRRQRAEEQAMKVPVKVVFPLILCILPTLFIVLIGPAVIQISRTLF